VVYRSRTPKRARLMDIEQKLDQWYIELPEELRYETSSKRPVPPPHIMVLHVRYWSAVLLLHRALCVCLSMYPAIPDSVPSSVPRLNRYAIL
jgi:hypothetical protein